MKREQETILERRYREVYESLCEQLEERRRTDPDFTPDDIRGFLRDAYVRQGNDWIGHGALFDATQGATIAAYEAVLAAWQEELRTETVAKGNGDGATPPAADRR